MTLKAGDIRQLLASTSTVKRVIGYIRVSSDELYLCTFRDGYATKRS